MKNLTCLHNGRSQITKQKLGGGQFMLTIQNKNSDEKNWRVKGGGAWVDRPNFETYIQKHIFYLDSSQNTLIFILFRFKHFRT